MSLLETITAICDQLGLPVRVGVFAPTPLPETFAVITPLGDDLDLFADNTPGMEVEHARLSLFTRGNYLGLRDHTTQALLTAGLTITSRAYVTFEADTGYHHYALDLARHHTI